MSVVNDHLTAVVGVCDEVEIIGHCLDHLERQGVDSIFVLDMLSRDGTRELLRQWRDAGRIVLIERINDSSVDAGYLGIGVDHARELWDPKWILLQDADEFCLAAGGNLRQAMARRQGGVFQLPRFNACLSADLLSAFAAPGRLAIETTDVWAAPCRLSREAMNHDPTVRWSAAQPAPKIIAEADLIAVVAAGGHAIADGDGNIIPPSIATDLLVVHVPFLSFPRFKKKMARAKDLIAGDRTYFQGATGWHWRRWIEMLDAGGLEEEYQRQYLDEAERVLVAEQGAIRRADELLVQQAYARTAA